MKATLLIVLTGSVLGYVGTAVACPKGCEVHIAWLTKIGGNTHCWKYAPSQAKKWAYHQLAGFNEHAVDDPNIIWTDQYSGAMCQGCTDSCPNDPL